MVEKKRKEKEKMKILVCLANLSYWKSLPDL